MSYLNKTIEAAEAAEHKREPISRVLAHALRQSRAFISELNDKVKTSSLTAAEAALR